MSIFTTIVLSPLQALQVSQTDSFPQLSNSFHLVPLLSPSSPPSLLSFRPSIQLTINQG